jgi:signal transduction histidine kinase
MGQETLSADMESAIQAAVGAADDKNLSDTPRTDMALQRLVRAERRAAVEEAMTALAHDCRNALQRMQSCLTLMKLRGNEEVQSLVADMQQTQDRLHRLYEEAQGAVAPLTLDRRHADVRKLVERVWRQLRLKWSEKSIDWAVRLDGTIGTRAFVDSQRLGQALRSVLESAIEVSPPHGNVACVFGESQDGNRTFLELAIEDSGPRISSNGNGNGNGHGFLYHTKHRGSGLGLAVAQRIIDEHDGGILIDDRSGGGARVVVTLPRDG